MGDHTREMLSGVSDPDRDGDLSSEESVGLVVFDILSDAIVGIGYRFDSGAAEQFICYDHSKCLDILASDMGDDSGTPRERFLRASKRLTRMIHGALSSSSGDSAPAFLMPIGDIGEGYGNDD